MQKSTLFQKTANKTKLETCCIQHQLGLSGATQANKPLQHMCSDLLAVPLHHHQKGAQQQATATKQPFCQIPSLAPFAFPFGSVPLLKSHKNLHGFSCGRQEPSQEMYRAPLSSPHTFFLLQTLFWFKTAKKPRNGD